MSIKECIYSYTSQVSEQETQFRDLFGKEELEEVRKRAFETLSQCCVDTAETLRELSEQGVVLIEETKEIAILEQRKKHCKNYLELKQINRRLSLLKFKQGRRRS